MARRKKPDYDRIALLLQGGGALGAYQVGVFEALTEHGYTPDWIAGTSIGAINGALIAGNAPQQRLARLDEFWRGIASEDPFKFAPQADSLRRFDGFLSAMHSLVLGQAGFFRPRLNPFGGSDAETASFYDTTPLKRTLERLVDFDLLNDGGMRLSVGAVSVTRGDLAYFDTNHQRLGAEHIMASGALPPGFPAVRVDGELFWDGGLYSNTPLETVLEELPRTSTLCFAINLWNRGGVEPVSIPDVLTREKEIRYASRFRNQVEEYRERHDMRRAIRALFDELPAEKRALPEFRKLADFGCRTTMHVVHLGHVSYDWELSSKDVDFSQSTLKERRRRGYRDAVRMLDAEPWKRDPGKYTGVVVHELPSVDADAG